MDKRNILIVDDDPLVRDMLALMLEDAGYQPVLATNGREALKIIHDDRPLLIISDVMMPVMDGWELFHTLNTHPDYHTIPFVMMSSLYSENYIRQTLNPDAVLNKPPHPEHLLALVEQVTGGTLNP